jgi:hypothetical protein
MKRIAFAVLAALLLPTAAAAQRKIEERFPASPTGFVRITNMVGSVKVTGWDQDSIVITGTVWDTKNEPFGVGRGANGTKFGIWDTGEKEMKPSQFLVRVPANSPVWVKTASAEITVEGVTGGLDLYSVSGAITVTGSPRELTAESMGGAIDVAASSRVVRAKTASGDIAIRGAIVDATATTVSGGLRVEGSRFERGRFESVDGDILYLGEIGRFSALDFVNHSGGVEFVLPPNVVAGFTVNTYEGALDDRYGVRVSAGGSKLKGKVLTFSIGGDAGGAVEVRTFKGNVVLRRK